MVPLRALRRDLLHNVVVRLRPVPPALQAPTVDDVADEIEIVAFVLLQEIQQQLGLATTGAEMDVRQKDRAMTGSLLAFDSGHVDNNPTDTKSVVRDCTNLSGLCMGAVARR